MRIAGPLFSWRIALLLLAATAGWLALTLPDELRISKDSLATEATVVRVSVVPKTTLLTLRVAGDPPTALQTVRASSFRQWQPGERVAVLMHPRHGLRIDSLLARHPLSLPGSAGIALLSGLLLLARRRKAQEPLPAI